MTSTSPADWQTAHRRVGLLIGDAERDATCQRLATHFAAGRLTADELDQRVNAAIASRTNVELHLLTADLPNDGTMPTPPAAAPVATPEMRLPLAATVAHAVLILTTMAAIGCTALLLMAVLFAHHGPGDGPGGLVWLASFGTAVSVAGTMYYAPRLWARRPSTQPAN